MEKNTQRLWFLFINDKEEGPIKEEDILIKIKNQKIPPEAFAYSDGMLDWQALFEIPVFKELFPQEKNTVSIGINRPLPVPPQANSNSPETSSAPNTETALVIKETPASIKTQRSWMDHPAVLYIFSILALGFTTFATVLYFWDEQNRSFNFAQLPFAEKFLPQKKAPVKKPQRSIASDQNSWSKLKNFRRTRTPSTATHFALERTLLPKNFGTLKGAVGSQIKATKILLVIYPEKNKTLSVLPQLRKYEVPLIKGYFVLGPLDLPQGTYKVYARSSEKDLGNLKIQIGPSLKASEISLFKKSQTGVTLKKLQNTSLALKHYLNSEAKLSKTLRPVAPNLTQEKSPQEIKSWEKNLLQLRNELNKMRPLKASIEEKLFKNLALLKALSKHRIIYQQNKDENLKKTWQFDWAEYSAALSKMTLEMRSLENINAQKMPHPSEADVRNLLLQTR